MRASSCCAALCLLLAASAGGLPNAAASRPGPTCTGKHVFIGVRGSGEHVGFGGTIGAVKVQLERTASGFAEFEAIDYVAVGVINPGNWKVYDASYKQGVEQLTNALYLKNSQCVNNSYGIAGYSQGADVVAGTLKGLWESRSQRDRDIAAQIDSVALLGDPRYNSKDVSVAAEGHRNGVPILAVLPSDHSGVRPIFPKALAAKVHSWCLPEDPVCDLGPAAAAACVRGTPSCASFLAAHIARHLHYASTGYTIRAADWMAHRVRSSIIPSAGDWHGTLLQDKSQVYPVDVHYSGGQPGEQVATVNYPTLGCSGQWFLARVSARAIVVREEITKNSHCIPVVDITLTSVGPGILDYKVSTPVNATGQLHLH